jgi:hypothetical protein
VHGDVIIGGPVLLMTTGLLFVEGMLAVFVAIDGARRLVRPPTGATPSRRLLFYVVPQALYVLLMFLGEINATPMIVTGVVMLMTPIVFVQSVVYLLRVVFPKPVAGGSSEEPATSAHVAEVQLAEEEPAESSDSSEPSDESPAS